MNKVEWIDGKAERIIGDNREDNIPVIFGQTKDDWQERLLLTLMPTEVEIERYVAGVDRVITWTLDIHVLQEIVSKHEKEFKEM